MNNVHTENETWTRLKWMKQTILIPAMKHEQCSYGKWNMNKIEMNEPWTMFIRKMKHEQDWNEWNMNNVHTENETWTRLKWMKQTILIPAMKHEQEWLVLVGWFYCV